ncbi:hypothetical protein [Labedella endophytica]|uniref:Uncharacterized protein n=1 Tax=Labedella endophytica TaxID=1523160 RepID=A0A3S0VHC2_9MICO|nr:hypothetical protein [Labedella endophytica]RUR01936.1 hypothetical protein ELQ94_10890 [Labedella endophytica]
MTTSIVQASCAVDVVVCDDTGTIFSPAWIVPLGIAALFIVVVAILFALAARRDPPARRPSAGWSDPGAARWFWTFSALGVVAMIAAWQVFGVAYEEEMSEQPKALAAGTSMAGTGAVFGGVPLIMAHLAGLVVLSVIAVRGRAVMWTGIVCAVLATAFTSGIGLLVAQVLWNGQLFMMGVDAPGLVPATP